MAKCCRNGEKKHTRTHTLMYRHTHTWWSLKPFTSSFNQNNKYSLSSTLEYVHANRFRSEIIVCVCVRALSQQYNIYQIWRMEAHKTTMMFRLSGTARFFLELFSLSHSLFNTSSSWMIFYIFATSFPSILSLSLSLARSTTSVPIVNEPKIDWTIKQNYNALKANHLYYIFSSSCILAKRKFINIQREISSIHFMCACIFIIFVRYASLSLSLSFLWYCMRRVHFIFGIWTNSGALR